MKAELTATFADEMAADDVLIMPDPVYYGGTTDKSVGTGDLIAGVAARGRHAEHIAERAACGERLAALARPGDRIVIMGARDDTLTLFAAGDVGEARLMLARCSPCSRCQAAAGAAARKPSTNPAFERGLQGWLSDSNEAAIAARAARGNRLYAATVRRTRSHRWLRIGWAVAPGAAPPRALIIALTTRIDARRYRGRTVALLRRRRWRSLPIAPRRVTARRGGSAPARSRRDAEPPASAKPSSGAATRSSFDVPRDAARSSWRVDRSDANGELEASTTCGWRSAPLTNENGGPRPAACRFKAVRRFTRRRRRPPSRPIRGRRPARGSTSRRRSRPPR